MWISEFYANRKHPFRLPKGVQRQGIIAGCLRLWNIERQHRHLRKPTSSASFRIGSCARSPNCFARYAGWPADGHRALAKLGDLRRFAAARGPAHMGRTTRPLVVVFAEGVDSRPSLNGIIACQVFNALEAQREERIHEQLQIIGLDTAKTSFALHGADASGATVFRKPAAGPSCCDFLANSHAARWRSRVVRAPITGTVKSSLCGIKPADPADVREPFVKRQKNDANDAADVPESVCSALEPLFNQLERLSADI